MAVAWPSGVPTAVRRDGVAVSGGNSRLAFEPDVGRPITRRRSSLDTEEYRIDFAAWTAAQFVTFRDWVRDDLGGGALEFALTDPITGVNTIWLMASEFEARKDPVKTYVHVAITVLRLRNA